MPLSLPKITHTLPWDQTRVFVLTGRWLVAWNRARRREGKREWKKECVRDVFAFLKHTTYILTQFCLTPIWSFALVSFVRNKASLCDTRYKVATTMTVRDHHIIAKNEPTSEYSPQNDMEWSSEEDSSRSHTHTNTHVHTGIGNIFRISQSPPSLLLLLQPLRRAFRYCFQLFHPPPPALLQPPSSIQYYVNYHVSLFLSPQI
jgi:hypothetical protein